MTHRAKGTDHVKSRVRVQADDLTAPSFLSLNKLCDRKINVQNVVRK